MAPSFCAAVPLTAIGLWSRAADSSNWPPPVGLSAGLQFRRFLLVGLLSLVAGMVCGTVPMSGTAALGQKWSSSRYFLGIRVINLTADLAHRLGLNSPEGVLVGQVYAGSPADRAGVMPGDIILTFAGKRLTSGQQFAELVDALPVGSRHRLEVIRQRSHLELEMEIGAAPADRGRPKAPGPSVDEAWYLHGTGDFWFRIPAGWKVVGERRNYLVDPEFDSLFSPDGRYVIICFKAFFGIADPQAALEEFVREKLQEVPQGHAWTMQVAGEPAVRVAYPSRDGRLTIYRISFCHAGRRYVINVVAPATEEVEELPAEVAAALGSLQFLREPAPGAFPPAGPAVKPPGTIVGEPTPESSLAGPVSSSTAMPPGAQSSTEASTPDSASASAGRSPRVPSEPPPDWKSAVVGRLKLWLPPEFMPEPMDDSREGRWIYREDGELLASIGIVYGIPQEELLGWMKVKEEQKLGLSPGEVHLYIGDLSDSGVPGRGMIALWENASGPWAEQAFCFFSREESWPEWEAKFLKILEILRPAEESR